MESRHDMTKQKDFDIRYEYIASEQSEMRLQRVFEMIFEKILSLEDINKSNYEQEADSLLR